MLRNLYNADFICFIFEEAPPLSPLPAGERGGVRGDTQKGVYS